ncbi:MAG: hypothetical protein IJ251_06455 [Oscillospiraceae bacterium]|nr:hypothetical protein [Oscillospiraceae bacterium]
MSRNKKNKKNNEVRKDNEIKAILDEAFEEDVNEMTELSDEKAAPSSTGHLHFIVGLFVLIMSVVGICCTGVFLYRKAQGILNNNELKDDLERFIYPVMICDPPSFEQSQHFRNDTMISAAAWDIIMYADKDRYSRDFDYITVPEIDIEQHADKIFGSNLTLEHHTISNSDVTFYYDPSIRSYRIPEQPSVFTYSPEIDSITKDGDVYTLRVGYVAPMPSWIQDSTQYKPFKYMNYTVMRNGTGYTLISINSVSDIQTDITD